MDLEECISIYMSIMKVFVFIVDLFAVIINDFMFLEIIKINEYFVKVGRY